MASVAHGYALGEMPSQTIGNFGQPLFDLMPTNAPSLELAKRNLAKKAVTNTCSEWTISDGLGYTPICVNSETCLFTSATDGYLYEGCGQTSIAYNWITACYDYNAQTGLPPVSQIYCDKTYPYCGYFLFIYDSLNTFYNFGCSDSSYSSTAYLVSTDSSSASLDGGGTTKITQAPTVTVTAPPDTTQKAAPTSPTGRSVSSAGASSVGSSTAAAAGASTTVPTSHATTTKKKTPVGAIVGGVVGGVAAIAIAAFLAWFCIRKNKKAKAANATNVTNETHQVYPPVGGVPVQQEQQHAYDATASGVPEMHGDPKPPTVFPPSAGYGQPGQPGYGLAGAYAPEKPGVNPNTYAASELGASTIAPQSPPPTYGQPAPNSPPISNYPPSNYTELEGGRQSVPPVSPAGTYSHTAASPSVSELGGTNRASYQAYNPAVPEMSAVAPAVQRPTRQSGMDMSGAPMSDNYHEMA